MDFDEQLAVKLAGIHTESIRKVSNVNLGQFLRASMHIERDDVTDIDLFSMDKVHDGLNASAIQFMIRLADAEDKKLAPGFMINLRKLRNKHIKDAPFSHAICISCEVYSANVLIVPCNHMYLCYTCYWIAHKYDKVIRAFHLRKMCVLCGGAHESIAVRGKVMLHRGNEPDASIQQKKAHVDRLTIYNDARDLIEKSVVLRAKYIQHRIEADSQK